MTIIFFSFWWTFFTNIFFLIFFLFDIIANASLYYGIIWISCSYWEKIEIYFFLNPTFKDNTTPLCNHVQNQLDALYRVIYVTLTGNMEETLPWIFNLLPTRFSHSLGQFLWWLCHSSRLLSHHHNQLPQSAQKGTLIRK